MFDDIKVGGIQAESFIPGLQKTIDNTSLRKYPKIVTRQK
jgi:hypothetical protein